MWPRGDGVRQRQIGDKRTLLLFDSGTDVAAESLGLAEDGRTLFWTRAGQPRLARFTQ